jgi:hypothetical protein
MKKVYAAIMILLINLINVVPVFAAGDNIGEYSQEGDRFRDKKTILSTSLEDEKVYLSPKSTYKFEFESDLDINETADNEEIYFRLVSPIRLSNGKYLPEHTRFAGRFKKVVKSKPLFKRARGYIIVDKILMPNEMTYTVRMEPKTGSDLKSSQVLNIIRAFPAGIGIIAFSAISVAVVAVESVSIVGLVVVPCTCRGFGLLISSMAKGLNYRVKAGSKIEFKLDTPAYINASDLK